MLINAELLLQYQRCKRRPYLDIHSDRTQRDQPTELLVKLKQDKIIHQKSILARSNYLRPTYRYGDWQTGASSTLELMQQGVECIYQGVLLANYADIDWHYYARVSESYKYNFSNTEYQNTDEIVRSIAVKTELPSNNTAINPQINILNTWQPSPFTALQPGYFPALISSPSQIPIPTIPPTREYRMVSCPDLLIKQPGKSRFGDWMYVPATIELGKRPKQEYQVVAAYHAQVLGMVQEVKPEVAYLILRGKDGYYPVDLQRWTVQMQRILLECVESMESETAPDLFISRQKCSLCHWYSDCYTIARSQQHLSLLPGVTPVRYTQLQALNITTPELLAKTNPTDLENLPGFDSRIATKIVIQAQSITENRPLLLPIEARSQREADIDYNPVFSSLSALRPDQIAFKDIRSYSDIELYFDIEAQPDLDLNYLLGVLVANKQANTEQFYSFLAEKPEDEELVWRQFVDLVSQYPDAPIYHFCIYEFDTVKRLAKLYHTPYSSVLPILSRFVDVYEELISSVVLPIESYALKVIARWLGFEWRDSEGSGAKCIYWYDQWLKTSDRALLEIIQRYNEDDCRATRSVKDWLAQFLQERE